MVADGDEVKRDQVIFSWDPYTNPIIADVGGTMRFVDLVEDESVSEELDELTGPPAAGRHRGSGQEAAPAH